MFSSIIHKVVILQLCFRMLETVIIATLQIALCAVPHEFHTQGNVALISDSHDLRLSRRLEETL